MVSNFCCLLKTDSPIRSPKPKLDKKKRRWTESAMKYINPISLLIAMKTRKAQLHRLEDLKQEMELCKNTSKTLTLEDFIISSPGFNKTDCNGGEHLLHVPRQSSRRIHPSFPGDGKEEALPTSLCTEILMETEAGKGQLLSSSFGRTKSEKLKKKVWFRSPEVADVFMLDSPVMYVSVEMEAPHGRNECVPNLD
ncbi:UNVERIFIED_CONTAM: hypothetical protein Scaly_1185900 [Sesamum calycinum]|uniref:Uncharacterized protein n=1 Tax=Sesamum calycinum TaxID=2727403 RepID=A0AAW2Q3J3_9LAMI